MRMIFPVWTAILFLQRHQRRLMNGCKARLESNSSIWAVIPRTTSVNEFTKATTIDFNLYYVPLSTGLSELRIGAGYSFSFYKTRRSYPVIVQHGGDQQTNWPVQDGKGRVSGFSLIGEYEYFFPETNFSVGLRASMFKAYDRVTFAGVFAGVRI